MLIPRERAIVAVAEFGPDVEVDVDAAVIGAEEEGDVLEEGSVLVLVVERAA